MIIELNTALLDAAEHINSNQLIFLSMVLDKNQKFNQDVRKLVSLFNDDDIPYLLEQGLIASIEKSNGILYVPTEKLREIVKPDKDYFDRFFEIYPQYVLRPDGTKGYLKSNINKCKNMFNTITENSVYTAQHLIDCLNYEIDNRIKVGKLGYMKTMWRWLVDHAWEDSEQAMQEEIPNNVGYGNELI